MEKQKPDCWKCRYGDQADEQTAVRHMHLTKGYSAENGDKRGTLVTVCTIKKTIRSQPVNLPGNQCRYALDR